MKDLYCQPAGSWPSSRIARVFKDPGVATFATMYILEFVKKSMKLSHQHTGASLLCQLHVLTTESDFHSSHVEMQVLSSSSWP